MFKKIALLLIALIALSVQAQTGDWRVHPYYVGSNIQSVIDTDNKVYYLVGSDLYCYDKSTQSTDPLNKRVALNDVQVTNIYYNYDKKYLVVTYINSNMDVIKDDGQIINLPDIKDLVLTGLKGINDVKFASGKMFVTTEFGLLVYDDQALTVLEARLFGVNFASAIQVGEWMVVSFYNNVYAAKASDIREATYHYKQVTSIPAAANTRLFAVNNERFLVSNNNGLCLYGNIADSTSGSSTVRYAALATQITTVRATQVQPTSTGFVACSPTYRIKLDKQGANSQFEAMTDKLYTSNPAGDGTYWELSANGLVQEGSSNYHKPNGIGIRVGAFNMAFNKERNLVYVSATSDNLFAQWGSSLGATTQIFTHDGSQWQDVTPSNLTGNGVSANWELVMDPMDPSTYVYASRKYGVFKIKDNQLAYVYGTSNSYFAQSNYYRGTCVFDSEGNLWVVYSSTSASGVSAQNVAVLPRAKYEQATCTKADWIPVDVPATKQKFFNGATIAIGKGDTKVYNSGGYQAAFAFWNQPDGFETTPQLASYSSMQDTDGKSITWDNVYCMQRDQEGLVWVGYTTGIMAFDPDKAFNEDFAVIQPKVPRNDGTGLSDYLLESLQVNCIAVDAANRKWIGTDANGLYQVSPDGTKILKHFTVDNSYLTSNTIYNVCCNTNTNSVYVLTPNGLLEYMADASIAAANYDDVYVYPNPVRPDFTGLLTITNLMSNSYLKVTNAQGQTVKQWQAIGGTATWDCCDSTGERMPTGLYTLYASQQSNDNNPKKVAEFLIIK